LQLEQSRVVPCNETGRQAGRQTDRETDRQTWRN